MKKILIVMTSLYNGGAEKSLVNLLNEMDEHKYEVDLLLFKRSGMFLPQVPSWVNILETPEDLKALYTPKNASKKSVFQIINRYMGTLISKLFTSNSREQRGMRWKYFYSHQINNLPGHYDVALAYISGEILYYVSEKVDASKKIVWIHSDYRSMKHPKKYDYPHLKQMDKIVSISKSCVDILEEEFPEFSSKMVVIPNITSSQLLKKMAMEIYPEEYHDNEKIILSIGRLTEVKGFDIAIKAAALLKKRNIRFKWFVIGSGELDQKLKKQIHQSQLDDEFILLGAKANPYPYIKNCTIFVQPSRHEGKSVVLDEAKILGKPILVTNYPTVSDQIQKDVEGYIVELNETSIADGIEKMITNSEMMKKFELNLSKKEYGNQDEIIQYYNLIEM